MVDTGGDASAAGTKSMELRDAATRRLPARYSQPEVCPVDSFKNSIGAPLLTADDELSASAAGTGSKARSGSPITPAPPSLRPAKSSSAAASTRAPISSTHAALFRPTVAAASTTSGREAFSGTDSQTRPRSIPSTSSGLEDRPQPRPFAASTPRNSSSSVAPQSRVQDDCDTEFYNRRTIVRNTESNLPLHLPFEQDRYDSEESDGDHRVDQISAAESIRRVVERSKKGKTSATTGAQQASGEETMSEEDPVIVDLTLSSPKLQSPTSVPPKPSSSKAASASSAAPPRASSFNFAPLRTKTSTVKKTSSSSKPPVSSKGKEKQVTTLNGSVHSSSSSTLTSKGAKSIDNTLSKDKNEEASARSGKPDGPDEYLSMSYVMWLQLRV
ncbi:unnamed protein product [Tilletia controversa]|uniref:Uncharacterized protein n=1 Tax=Tilletia controversa TaxID=13291 RepID=A0A8X7MMG4_9BASI|nr:hypothetical protein CF328_g8463 [Tilletia controversa]KAE8242199.1 hypothetical protein A4X06_0g7134 [Tilletia controversa]CAD6968372.1 unnamed protein product [Tilletia controversa]CAD6968625.1 unnamed protein product [Tilletia controversa]